MKTNTLKVLIVGAALTLASPIGRAADTPARVSLHFGITPLLDHASAGRVLTNLNRLLLTLPAGVEFYLEDGYDGSIISSGSVPALEFPSPAAQARALAKPMVTLRDWLSAPRSGPLAGSGALNPPVYLRSVAEHRGHGRLVILLIGSVMYANPAEPAFDFAPDRLPLLSHLPLNETVTPFGCGERRTLLQGVAIHWCYLSSATMPFEGYGNASRFWWQHWVHAQGGILGEFTHDWSLATKDLFRPLEAPTPLNLTELGGPDPKPEMRGVDRRSSALRPGPPQPAREEAKAIAPAPAPTRAAASMQTIRASVDRATPPVQQPPAPRPAPLVVQPATQPPVAGPSPSSPVRLDPLPSVEVPREVNLSVSSVGIKWRSRGNDLDLSLRVKPGAPLPDPGELYWNTPPRKTPGAKFNALGRYLHDYREGNEEYEWIELAQSMTMASLAASFELWCDNFAGPGPVSFTAVVVDHGKVLASRELTIPARGDAREQAGRRETSSSWLCLPIASMLEHSAH